MHRDISTKPAVIYSIFIVANNNQAPSMLTRKSAGVHVKIKSQEL